VSPGGSGGEAGAHPARVTASVAPSATTRGPFDPAYRLISVALVALITNIAFEAMAISTAMPSAARDLDAVRSYVLAFSVLLTAQLLGIVLAGVWVDRAGPLPSLFTGQVLLAGGSGLCAVSGSLAPFLLGRAVTGLGAGLIVVTGYVLVGRTYPDATRPRVFSMLSAAWVLPSLVGAPIAAWLTSTWSWRAVFGIVVVPVVATIAVVAARRAQIAGRVAGVGHSSRDHRAHVRAAWAGALIAAAAGALQFGTHELDVRWSARAVVALLGLVGVMVAAPLLVPRGTWRMAHGLPSVVLARSLMTAAFFGSITYLPLMLVGERGLSLAVAGIILSIGSLGWSAGSWLQGRDALNGRRERLVAAGGAALACGLLLLAATAWFGWPSYLCALALVVGGLGMGCATASMSVLTLALAPSRDHGSASSSLQLADVLGSVLGIAGATAVFAALHRSSGSDGEVYALIWTALAVVAGLVVLAGRRIRG
jgi:MFS family permease